MKAMKSIANRSNPNSINLKAINVFNFFDLFVAFYKTPTISKNITTPKELGAENVAISLNISLIFVFILFYM